MSVADLPPAEAPRPVKPKRSGPPGWIVPLVGLLGAAFGGFIVYASLRGDFAAEFGAITMLPWGQVTLADLYLGFVFVALAVFAVESSWRARLFWALPTFFLGNVWPAIWIVVRWRVILARLGWSQTLPADQADGPAS